MPILVKCSNCNRVGGYAKRETDDVCARCLPLVNKKDENKNEDENEE